MDYQPPKRQKFGIVEGEMERPYHYVPSYFRETLNDGSERLVLAGPTTSHSQLLIDLAATFPDTSKILYVLVVPRNGTAEPGRYESPDFLQVEEVARFIDDFSEFFESDGRHHLWIACPDHATLVFDRHNVIYAYGDLEAFEAVADAHGMRRREFSIPIPHWHKYHAEYDAIERRLLKRWDWVYSPLRPQDEA